jgi:hypothetical protein
MIFLFLLTKAGAFDSSLSTTAGQINTLPGQDVNASSSTVPTKLSGGTSYFKVLFSFFAWNITISSGFLSEYLWVFRVVFVWVPILFAGLALWYSTALSSGGG